MIATKQTLTREIFSVSNWWGDFVHEHHFHFQGTFTWFKFLCDMPHWSSYLFSPTEQVPWALASVCCRRDKFHCVNWTGKLRRTSVIAMSTLDKYGVSFVGVSLFFVTRFLLISVRRWTNTIFFSPEFEPEHDFFWDIERNCI